ncbi:hypothetical protein [Lacrimispora amygdalina]|uniref:hypothetical protein n=1 Tax=Lacrimispora amygdalina TaxID=253257 RepID=UPI000BE35C49|nr:hypothetical protein [Lacrimispora amygdalina]
MPGALTEIFKEFKELFLEIFLFIIMGSDKTSKKQMYSNIGRKIRISKDTHLAKRKIEFCIRICIFAFACYYFNVYIMSKIFVEPYVIIGVLVMEWFVLLNYHEVMFKRNLVGFDNNDFKRMREVSQQLTLIHTMVFAINSLDLLFDIINLVAYAQAITILIIFIYCCYIYDKMKSKTIYSFRCESEGNIGIAVDLAKDIKIHFKNGYIENINLLISNLYICDDDNILILSKNSKRKLYNKNRIIKISVKNENIVYDSLQNKWVKKENRSLFTNI